MIIAFIICIVSAFLMGVIIGSSNRTIEAGSLVITHTPSGPYIVLNCTLNSEELEDVDSIKLRIEHVTYSSDETDSRKKLDL